MGKLTKALISTAASILASRKDSYSFSAIGRGFSWLYRLLQWFCSKRASSQECLAIESDFIFLFFSSRHMMRDSLEKIDSVF
jgi:hypothetical protein